VTRQNDLERLLISVHALARIAASHTGSTAPQAQWRTLSLLENRGAMRLGELATASRVTQPGMTRLVGQMADAGLVERSGDPDDSRAVVVAPTEKGLAELAAWRTHLAEVLTPWFDDLDDDEWAALHKAASILESRTRTKEVAR
jgi:DNA-binding MarR family transcriptional regulator